MAIQEFEPNPMGMQLVGQGAIRGLKEGFEDIRQKAEEHKKEDALRNSLISTGLSPQQADLYMQFTKGGQTKFAEKILEDMQRSKEVSSKGGIGDEFTDEDITEFVSQQDEGLTPKERVKRQSERYQSGLKPYQEATTKLKSAADNKRRIETLESIDKTGKLPKGLGRWNVDKYGNLRAPFAAGAEAERYTKIINEWVNGAKDSFGARVTGFELQAFMKQFPNLANSKEGRKQIYEQMKIINDINSVFYKNLKNVVSKAGGIRNIDWDLATELAEKKSEKEIDRLSEKLINLTPESTDSIIIENKTTGRKKQLSAKNAKGKKVEDPDTGEVMISDGIKWIPQKGEEIEEEQMEIMS